MNDKNQILEDAKEIFQSLDPLKQSEIKNNEPDIYKMLFSNMELDNKLIEDFINRYSSEDRKSVV